MYAGLKVYALYRVLYGEDFIQESIKSIAEYVDKIFIFWTDRPWGDVSSCFYKGREVLFPRPVDDALGKAMALGLPKLEILHDHVYCPKNQFTHWVNDRILPCYARPDIVLMIEPDHVFRRDQAEGFLPEFISSGHRAATTLQIELWRTPLWRLPPRPRGSTTIWDLRGIDQVPQTGTLAGPVDFELGTLSTFVHNLGYCRSDKLMFWVHLIAVAYAPVVGDSIRNENWYEEKWLGWDPLENNSNLEPSTGAEHHIPYAEPYPVAELPEVIRAKYGYE